jgi:hypothetical protein
MFMVDVDCQGRALVVEPPPKISRNEDHHPILRHFLGIPYALCMEVWNMYQNLP